MTRQPTQTEIQQAEELQRLGLFQYINAFVWKHYAENKYEISLRYHRNDDWLKIGPLPTASECWSSLIGMKTTIDQALNLIGKAIEKYQCGGNLDISVRWALIEKHSEKL